MQVPEGHARLARVGIPALVVAVVADVHRVECIQKAERAVIDGQTEQRHVVGVHHAMTKTNELPLRDEPRRATSDFFEQRGRAVDAGEVALRRSNEQLLQRLLILCCVRKVLEVAEAQERRRDARHHRRGFHRLAPHRLRRRNDGQRARRRDAQSVHRLRAQELADRGAQHGTAVAHARVGREAAALQLHFHRAGRGVDFAEQQRAAIAQLPGPDAELVAGVHRRKRPHAVGHLVAGEHRQRLRRFEPFAQTQLRCEGIASRHPRRLDNSARRQLGAEGRAERLQKARMAPGRGKACRECFRGVHEACIVPCWNGLAPCQGNHALTAGRAFRYWHLTMRRC